MIFIRKETLTPSQAKHLEHMGFVLKLLSIGRTVDTYAVYVK